MTTTIIIVAPVATRPGYFTARCDGRLLCRSKQPLLAAARELIASGYPADAVVVMRHAGSETEALRSTVGAAARLTVAEGDRGAPRFRRWKAMPLREGSPPIAPLGRAATPAPEWIAEAVE
jgi:hypothetical protein